MRPVKPNKVARHLSEGLILVLEKLCSENILGHFFNLISLTEPKAIPGTGVFCVDLDISFHHTLSLHPVPSAEAVKL